MPDMTRAQINVRLDLRLSRAIDIAVQRENLAGPPRRVTRAALLRAAIIEHLSNHADPRVRATVARRVA